MWPFRRTKQPTVTNEVYLRWLRAQRPPWLWFLSLSEMEQEHVAGLGDIYVQEAIAMGHDLAEAPEAGAQTEETIARQIASVAAKAMASRAQAPPQAPPAAEPVSMGGLSERRAQADAARQEARDAGRSLFGRAPDGAAG
jgi:hypothetical protein